MSNTNIGFTEDKIEKQKGLFPIAECVPDVELESIRYDEGKFGPQVEMVFARNEGVTEESIKGWKSIPQRGDVIVKDDETEEEAYIRNIKGFNTYMKHIANQFPGINEQNLAECAADTEQETVENICNLIMEHSKGVKLWLKTERQKKTKYAKIPSYPKFVQRMTEDTTCELQWSDRQRKNAEKVGPTATAETADEADLNF